MIITFEGGEGAGKSTHAKLLCAHLEQSGLPWLSIREPGGSPFSERLRSVFFTEGLDPMTELLLILASRRENIKKVIEPGLAQGKIIVIDRFVDSTLVYQGALSGIGIERTKEIMEKTGTLLEPDLTFIMDIDPEHALKRIVPGDKFENRDLSFHRKIRSSFLDLAVDERHVIIDADRSPEEVCRLIRAAADRVLSGKPEP